MSYQIQLPQFKGPFDLLLQLIEKEKLDISEVSLAQVTDRFLNHINKIEQVQPHELADFLEIAAKLILLKSRLLIPEAVLDDETGQDLVDQLKIYRQYALVTKKVGRIAAQPKYAFARERIPLEIVPDFSLEIKITPKVLERIFKNLASIILKQIKLTQETFKQKIISLKEKIGELLEVLKKEKKVIFHSLVKKRQKPEKIAMFLAVLELIKRKEIVVNQKGLFKEIVIKRK
ncbi:segregation/condensation protein A [Patescibacteria group bacterium]|nr:segregation/condensation protein A [Patescibacteria group bacterium]